MSAKPSPADVAAEICSKTNASLERQLGAGAFKQAFLIKRDDQYLALKIAPLTPSLQARFEREIQALAGCDHPAIARLHSFETYELSGDRFWVIFEEFLSAGTLTEQAAAEKFDVDRIRSIAVTLADALVHLHPRRFVHRDIKPANIMFRNKAEPVLTDFGIVRMLDATSLTHDFLPHGPGTPLYASPEQLLNEKAQIDWRSDQFGLSLVIGECVLGRHPFLPASGDVREAVSAMARRERISSEAANELAARGFSAIAKGLSPWPVQRFRFPEEYRDSLKRGD